MKSLRPEQRAELVRILREIKSDVSELRALFERLHTDRGSS